MKKILIIDNTFDPPHGCPEIQALVRKCTEGLGTPEIIAVRAPDGAIPADLSHFAGVVLSGSKTRIEESAPWIDAEIEAVRRLHTLKIPTLGICYGEQIIAKALGAQTGASEKNEFGWARLEIEAESPLFKGLPKSFYSFEYHSDEVRSLPINLRLTASSADCPIQAYDVLDAPMWGVQFHPERSLNQGISSLERREKQKNAGDRLINRDKGPQLYDANVGETIFKNFLKMVWARN